MSQPFIIFKCLSIFFEYLLHVSFKTTIKLVLLLCFQTTVNWDKMHRFDLIKILIFKSI